MWLERGVLLAKRATISVAKWMHAVAAATLVVMMMLGAADVCGRYAFNRPILGTLDLTEFMMVLVVFLGFAQVQVEKGNVTLSIAVERWSVRTQAVINSIGYLASLVVFALMSWGSFIYAESLRVAQAISPSYSIPVYPFVYVTALSVAIFCVVLFADLVGYITQVVKGIGMWKRTGLLLLVVAALMLLTAPAWGQGLIWEMSPNTTGFFFTGFLIAIMFTGVPIGFIIALVGFMGMFCLCGLDIALPRMAMAAYTTSASFDWSIFPLFILMGEFCFYAGLSQDLYRAAYKWLGQLPGGLASATVAACACFAAVSGSSQATAASMATVSIPEMRRYKYDPALATGCIAAGGTMGILIPPSVALVVYGILTQQSIGRLFLAGIIPGIMEAVFYIITIYIICKRNPVLGPPGPKTSLKEKVVSLRNTWGVLLLFLLVIGGLYMGVFTPTEAAAVGAFGSLLFALSKKISWNNFKASLYETISVNSMGFVLFIAGAVLSYFLTLTRLPFDLADMIIGLELNRYSILAVVVFVYLFLGCVMPALPVMIITVPIFFPLIVAVGFDPIWFGIIMVMILEIAAITPPVGINVFVIYAIAKDVPLHTIFRGIVPFLIADFLRMTLLIVVPQISLFLPSLMH